MFTHSSKPAVVLPPNVKAASVAETIIPAYPSVVVSENVPMELELQCIQPSD